MHHLYRILSENIFQRVWKAQFVVELKQVAVAVLPDELCLRLGQLGFKSIHIAPQDRVISAFGYLRFDVGGSGAHASQFGKDGSGLGRVIGQGYCHN